MQLSGTEQSIADARTLGLWTPRSAALTAHYNRVQRRGKHGLVVRPLASTLGRAAIAASAEAITVNLSSAAAKSFTTVRAVASSISGHASDFLHSADALAADTLSAISRRRDALRPQRPHLRRIAVAAGLAVAFTGTALAAGAIGTHSMAAPRSANVVTSMAHGGDSGFTLDTHAAMKVRVAPKAATTPMHVTRAAVRRVHRAAPTRAKVHVVTVKPHDTLNGIAATYRESLGQIEKDNPASRLPSKSFDLIYPGNKIVVTPGGRAAMPAVATQAGRPSRQLAAPRHRSTHFATTFSAAAPMAMTVAAPTGSVQSLIRAVFGADSAWGLAVAKCESGYNPMAVNPSGDASGVFQFLRQTWAGTPWANFSRFNALANIRAAKWLKDKYGPGQWVCKG